MTFRLTADEHANLKANAEARDQAKAELIRSALEAQGLLEAPKKRAR